MSKQMKTVLKLASMSLFVVSLAACGSSQTTSTTRDLGSPLDIVNKGLAQYGYSPDNDGYGYKEVAFPLKDQKYIEDRLAVLMVNSVGESDGSMTAGQSAIWNERGEIEDQLNDRNRGLLIFDTNAGSVEKR